MPGGRNAKCRRDDGDGGKVAMMPTVGGGGVLAGSGGVGVLVSRSDGGR